jgi:hypothetical protein
MDHPMTVRTERDETPAANGRPYPSLRRVRRVERHPMVHFNVVAAEGAIGRLEVERARLTG